MERLDEQYMEAHGGTITEKTIKTFQKQKMEHKTDLKADRKAQDQQEKKGFLCPKVDI